MSSQFWPDQAGPVSRVAPTRWISGEAASAIDSETAAELRSCLGPIFAGAESWAALVSDLGRKGYGLAFVEGRMRVVDSSDGHAICTGRFLGLPFAALQARLGRPKVRPMPMRPNSGEVIG